MAAPEDDPEQSQSNGLVPDAVATDGVLNMLAQGRGHRRTVSFESRRHILELNQQTRYNQNLQELSAWLNDLQDLLVQVRNFASRSDVFYPESGQFKVLALDVKMGSHSVGSSILTRSASQYLAAHLSKVLKHVLSLRNRIQDTNSQVLITGDLNAGKSSLCNALLRRPLLPVDQQPCTDVFCEVADSSKNDDREEVHAVLTGKKYSRDDLTSYKVFALQELDNLVHESEAYALLKVYVKDNRDPSQSLLANGVVDICLIDAPGLNVDVGLTEELFGCQDDIDLVIFVVSAENHFTQSSKEFVSHVAQEKSLVFIVANNYDKIRDTERCKNRIMNQVADLVPETHKGAGDFVHFVNSNWDKPNSPEDDPRPYGPGTPDFDQLESSLRNFVLEKRSISKLAPARTFLLNTLRDLEELSQANLTKKAEEYEDLVAKLDDLSPSLDKTITESVTVGERIDRDIERLSRTVYSQSVEFLTKVVDSVGEAPVVQYSGIFDILNYASQTREVIVKQIQEAVTACEENAKDITATAVDAIRSIGILHVGERPAFSKVFQKSVMFKRRRDNLSRHIKAELSPTDFVDFSLFFNRQLPVLQASKAALFASTSSTLSSSLALCSVVGGSQLALSSRAVRGALSAVDWLNWANIRRLALPVTATAVALVSLFIVHELPFTVPRRIARKVALEIDEMGYVQSNAHRISTECRKVLRYPAHDVRAAFQSDIDSRSRQRDELRRNADSTHETLDFFQGISETAGTKYRDVSRCVLECDLTVD